MHPAGRQVCIPANVRDTALVVMSKNGSDGSAGAGPPVGLHEHARGRSMLANVGGSWAERRENAIDHSPVAPGHITPRSQPQSQMLRSLEAASPSQHPTAFLSGRQDLNLRPPGPQPGALPDCATPRGSKRATGIEPALKAWKAFVQPQHFARRPRGHVTGALGSRRPQSSPAPRPAPPPTRPPTPAAARGQPSCRVPRRA
jgi:hypothetical protein